MRLQSPLKFASVAITAGLLTSCSSAQINAFNDQVRTIGKEYGKPILCVTGVAVGAAAGYALNERNGALIGAGIGGAIGCAVGAAWQQRLQELDRIAKEEQLTISIEEIKTANQAQATQSSGLVAQIEDTGMFPSGSAELTPAGQRAVQKIAETYATSFTQGNYGERRLLVVGHTDATGGAQLNQRLSEQRARRVGEVLRQAGVPSQAIYYQGAGASRPVVSNADPLLRAKNRRVEITEVTSSSMLAQRVSSEANNPRYLQHGTATTAQPSSRTSAATQTQPSRQTSSSTANTNGRSTAKINFAGVPAGQQAWELGQLLQPKRDGFSLISSAHAQETPMSSCVMDMPRMSGEVRSLATGDALERPATRDHLAGYNRVWANTVNNHLVMISPVSILRDGARVGRQPFLQVVENYGTDHSTTHKTIQAFANTYEGENEVLYRVFATESSSPISCIDVVFSKQQPSALGGTLFYPDRGENYTSTFLPVRS